jgi:hypothetical protein
MKDQNWRISAVADVNGDGWPDLIWRNKSTGKNLVWYMSGGYPDRHGQPARHGR